MSNPFERPEADVATATPARDERGSMFRILLAIGTGAAPAVGSTVGAAMAGVSMYREGVAGYLVPLLALCLAPSIAGGVAASQGRSSATLAGAAAAVVTWTLAAGPVFLLRLQAPIFEADVDDATLRPILAMVTARVLATGCAASLLVLLLGASLGFGVAMVRQAPSTRIEGISVLIPSVSLLTLLGLVDVLAVSSTFAALASSIGEIAAVYTLASDVPTLATSLVTALTMLALSALLAGRVNHPLRSFALGPRLFYGLLLVLTPLTLLCAGALNFVAFSRPLPFIGAAVLALTLLAGVALAAMRELPELEVLTVGHIISGAMLAGIAWMVVHGVFLPGISLAVGSLSVVGALADGPPVDHDHMLRAILAAHARFYGVGFVIVSIVALAAGFVFATVEEGRREG